MSEGDPGSIHFQNDCAKDGITIRLRLAAWVAMLSIFSTALMSGCSRPSAHDTSAYIRVNQLGYESGLPMRAFLMADAGRAGTGFTLQGSNGKVVFTGAVGSPTGQWGK